MEELDYDHRIHQMKDNQALAVRFYIDAIQDDEASAREGRPIFNDVEMIEKRVRGNRNDIVQRPANDHDRREFREIYRAFKEDMDQAAVSGTPLKEWPVISKSMMLELRHMGFHTVEQVAQANDGVCSKMAGLQTLKQKAIAYLEIAKGSSAPLEILTKQVTDLTNQVTTLMRQNQELSAKLEAKA